jgi:hypothetical protein
MRHALALLVCLLFLAGATAGLVIAIVFRNSEISEATFVVGGIGFVVFGLGFAAVALVVLRNSR